MPDHSEILSQKLQSVSSLQNLCKHWATDFRGTAVAAQSVLRIFYPHGAELIAKLITLLDAVCSAPPSP